jgi:hypothetical protein
VSYAAGSHTLPFDGRGLAGGTYFAKILIDGAVVKTVPVMKVEQLKINHLPHSPP